MPSTNAERASGLGPALFGALGSTLVLLGSLGSGGLAGRVGPTAQENLRFLSTGSSGLASTMLVWAGTIALVCAWCAVGVRIRAGLPQRWGLLLAAWIVPLLPALPVFSADAFSYLAQGQMLGGPADPYVDGPGTGDGDLARFVHPDWRYTPTPYGALHLVLMSGIAHVAPSSPWLAIVALRVLVIACLAACAWVLPRIAAYTGVSPERALWLGVANPLVLVHLVGGLHNDAFILTFVLGATWCVCAAAGDARRAVALLAAAGALIGLAASIKITSIVALPFLAWIAGRRLGPAFVRGVWMTALAGATCAAVTALSGAGFGWIGALSVSDRVVYWISLPTAMAHLASVTGAVSFEDALSVTRYIGMAFMVLGVLAAWWWSRPSDVMGEGHGPVFGAGVQPTAGRFSRRVSRVMLGLSASWAALFVANVVSWPWYWGVVLAALAVAAAPSARTGRRLVTASVAGTVFVLATVDPSGSPTLYKLSFFLGTAALTVAAAWWASRARPGDVAPGPGGSPGSERHGLGPAHDLPGEVTVEGLDGPAR